MKRLFWVGALAILALALGLWLGGAFRKPSAYESELASMNLEMARTMLPFKIAFRVLVGGVILLTLAGLGWGGVRWLHRRVDTLYPDQAGLYPIREGRVGQAKVFHDPNRTLGGTTVYADGEPDVAVRHPVPDGQEMAQERVTAQAQAAQALRAAVSGIGSPPPNPDPPLDLLDQQRVTRPLPEVKTLDLEPSHIERLLLEKGE